MFWSHWFVIGIAFGSYGLVLGAYGARYLKQMLPPDDFHTFETAIRYHLYHSFALLAVSFANTRVDNDFIRAAGFSFVLGILLFCGGLHLIAFVKKARSWAGSMALLGGIFLILGWVFLALTPFF